MNPLSPERPDAFDDGVSIAVVYAVAAKRGVDPLEVPPLYDWIDPEALDALFDRATVPTAGGRDRHVEFRYDGHDVTISATEDLEIRIDGERVGPAGGRLAVGSR